MPFIPHTREEKQAMLEFIGVSSIEDLFDEVPVELRTLALTSMAEPMTEMEVSHFMEHQAKKDAGALIFLGAGAYDHYIPAAVWQLASRGEYYSAYTPYQAEASQGTLQLLYEYQSMITALTAMEVSNASLYDGASALAEAILMAVRLNKKSKSRRILVPKSLHPAWRKVVKTIVTAQKIEIIELPYDSKQGRIAIESLNLYQNEDICALVIAQPNFFGVLEEVDALTDWAKQQGVLSIAVVNPVAMALLKPPGKWGVNGVDICCGEGQPLGIPLHTGGPYFGFLCSGMDSVRQMPGRIVGRTIDREGKTGYTLTLQAREQHIRRSKATSNICTNQGLMVTAATIHMSLMGAKGLYSVAAASHSNVNILTTKLCGIEGIERRFESSVFHEQVLCFAESVPEVLRSLAAHNILGGYYLGLDYPELSDCLLICATEKRTQAEIDLYADKLARVIKARTTASCPVRPKI